MLTDPELQEPGSESSDTSEDVDHSILCVKDKLSPRLSGGVHTQYIVHCPDSTDIQKFTYNVPRVDSEYQRWSAKRKSWLMPRQRS